MLVEFANLLVALADDFNLQIHGHTKDVYDDILQLVCRAVYFHLLVLMYLEGGKHNFAPLTKYCQWCISLYYIIVYFYFFCFFLFYSQKDTKNTNCFHLGGWGVRWSSVVFHHCCCF